MPAAGSTQAGFTDVKILDNDFRPTVRTGKSQRHKSQPSREPPEIPAELSSASADIFIIGEKPNSGKCVKAVAAQTILRPFLRGCKLHL